MNIRSSPILVFLLAAGAVLAAPSYQPVKHVITGRVVVPDDRPLNGITVTFSPLPDESPGRRLSYQFTDGLGVYYNLLRMSGDWEVRVDETGFLPYRKLVSVEVDGRTELDIHLKPLTARDTMAPIQGRGTISGVVLHHEFRFPIADARIVLDPGKNEVCTDERGRFTLPALTLGKYSVSAGKDGYLNGGARVTVIEDDTATATIFLHSGSVNASDDGRSYGALRGVIQDALTGRPVAGTVRTIVPKATDHSYRRSSEFLFEKLYAGYVSLVVSPLKERWAERFEPLIVDSVFVAPDDTTWTIVRVPLHYACDPPALSEEPGIIRVRLVVPLADERTMRALEFVEVRLQSMPHRATPSGGACLLADVPPGAYTLVIEDDRYMGGILETVHGVHVFPGETTTVTVRLEDL